MFEIGNGNENVANALAPQGLDVTGGVCPSAEGIAQAVCRYLYLKLAQDSVYDDLIASYGRYPVATSLEEFWSVKTLGLLQREAGFADIRFIRMGRIPLLPKCMIAVARKT